MLALLPEDALRDAMAPLPAGVDVVAFAGDQPPPQAEFVVLDPRQAGRFAAALPALTGLRVVQTLNAGVEWVPPLPEHVTLCNAGGVHDARSPSGPWA